MQEKVRDAIEKLQAYTEVLDQMDHEHSKYAYAIKTEILQPDELGKILENILKSKTMPEDNRLFLALEIFKLSAEYLTKGPSLFPAYKYMLSEPLDKLSKVFKEIENDMHYRGSDLQWAWPYNTNDMRWTSGWRFKDKEEKQEKKSDNT